MIKPIRTHHDLESAKERLALLIRGNRQHVHDDEIEVLAALVERYEEDAFPIETPSPVAAIKFRMTQQGLTPRQLEPFIGSRARVSEVLSSKRPLTLDMIRSLHAGLKIPYESLIAERRQDSVVAKAPEAVERLQNLGFDLGSDHVAQYVRSMESVNPQRALHRRTRTQRAASKMDQGALVLWQAAVLSASEEWRAPRRFDPQACAPKKLREIARLSRRPDGPVRAIKVLNELGISTVYLPGLPGTFLDGAAMARADGTPVIGLTLRHDRVDNFWFTLLHEASHLALHYDELVHTGASFIDDLDIRSDDVAEKEADALAGRSLIPDEFISSVHWGRDSSYDDIIAVSVQACVHISLVAGRWQRDHQNYKKFSRMIERGTVRGQLTNL